MPEIAVAKDSHSCLRENYVRLAREISHVNTVAKASSPQSLA